MAKDIILIAWAVISLLLALAVIILLIKVSILVIRDPEMKWYKRLKWHLKELRKTLSNEPSAYSSKRIERLIIFLNACVTLDIIIFWLIHKDKIGAAEATLIYGTQMIYAGYQTKQIQKDIKPKVNEETQA